MYVEYMHMCMHVSYCEDHIFVCACMCEYACVSLCVYRHVCICVWALEREGEKTKIYVVTGL